MPTGAAPLVLLAAGGTGGHLFPAEALADALQKRGAVVDLATDTRAAHFKFPARAVHLIPSATLRGRNPLALARTAALLALGTAKAWAMIGRIRPAVVVGFGGYPTVPPLMAARLRGIPTVLHEQNGVMGRANRLLAPRVTAIATGFRTLARLDPRLQGKDHLHRQSGAPGGDRRGGDALCRAGAGRKTAPAGVRRQPGRARDGRDRAGGDRAPERRSARAFGRSCSRRAPRTSTRCARLTPGSALPPRCAPFFSDLPARMAAAASGDFSRSGASTVAELSAIGRPAILVPLPHALDQDQFANAGVLEAAGGAIRIEQRDFTPERLAAEIAALAGDPGRLVTMAQAAKSAGTLDAAERLADLVLKVAGI